LIVRVIQILRNSIRKAIGFLEAGLRPQDSRYLMLEERMSRFPQQTSRNWNPVVSDAEYHYTSKVITPIAVESGVRAHRF
jgi:hypothetical protein